MKKIMLICLIVILLIGGCGVSQEQTEETVTLVIASFGDNREIHEQAAIFNENHTDYQIEIRQYFRYEQEEGDGIQKLQREIVSGNGPDIINFGREYSVTDILGEYTEDLSPYLANLSSEEEDVYFTNILEAFSYQNKLFAVPVSFTLHTYAGRSSVIGNRKSWTIEELMFCYQEELEKSEGSLMLYPGETKKDVFGSILTGSVESFVDWEERTCSFDSSDFKKIMEFANQFPDTLNITEDFSPFQCYADGKALLYPLVLSSVYDICKADLILGEDAVYIGYPAEGEDGTVIDAMDLVLAISMGCEHKEIAWDFISQFLSQEYQNNITEGFPVCKTSLEAQLKQGQIIEYIEDEEGKKTPVEKARVTFEGEAPLSIYQITDKQAASLLQIIEKTSVASAYNSRLHSILLQEIDGYFNGDKSLDETAEVIQRIVQIYVNEI